MIMSIECFEWYIQRDMIEVSESDSVFFFFWFFSFSILCYWNGSQVELQWCKVCVEQVHLMISRLSNELCSGSLKRSLVGRQTKSISWKLFACILTKSFIFFVFFLTLYSGSSLVFILVTFCRRNAFSISVVTCWERKFDSHMKNLHRSLISIHVTYKQLMHLRVFQCLCQVIKRFLH